jgi:hypothetical protein
MGYRTEAVPRSTNWLPVAERAPRSAWSSRPGTGRGRALDSRRAAGRSPRLAAPGRLARPAGARAASRGVAPRPAHARGGERRRRGRAGRERGHPPGDGAAPARPSGEGAFPTPVAAFMGASLTGPRGPAGLVRSADRRGVPPAPELRGRGHGAPAPERRDPRGGERRGRARALHLRPTMRVGFRLRSFTLDGASRSWPCTGSRPRSPPSRASPVRGRKSGPFAPSLPRERRGSPPGGSASAPSFLGGRHPELEVLGADSPSDQHDAEQVAALRSPIAALTLGLEVGWAGAVELRGPPPRPLFVAKLDEAGSRHETARNRAPSARAVGRRTG